MPLESDHAVISAILGDNNATEILNAIGRAIRDNPFEPSTRYTASLGQAVYEITRTLLAIKADEPRSHLFDSNRD